MIPACLWSAPVPVIGLAPHWDLLWHSYRHQLPLCDLVLADSCGVATLKGQGITHARAVNLCGCERSWLDEEASNQARDIDILVIGNLHPAVHRKRLAWLPRLARLRERWRVSIRQEFSGQDCRALLSRARIVFHHSEHGQCAERALETAAAGALLFQEPGNREVTGYFRDRHECVSYTTQDVESLLEYYLEHEDERSAMAERAHQRVRALSFEQLWQQHLTLIEQEWPAIIDRARRRLSASESFPTDRERLSQRLWETLGASQPADAALSRDLATALVREPTSASLHNALGLAIALTEAGHVPPAPLAQRAAGHFRRALVHDPGHPLAGLNLAEALLAAGQREAAAEQAKTTLKALESPDAVGTSIRWLDDPHFPPGYDLFRVEWERAAWSHAGQPAAEAAAKLALVRWRLHTLVADLSGTLSHYYEAVLARPDFQVTRAALGCALARAGQFQEALPHLRRAVADNPLDRDAARALFEALGQAGDGTGQRRWADERRLLAQAAPDLVPAEPWITNTPPVGAELASILILCCNELPYTRLCLESVLQHTRPPFELVLIDNGSSDGTPAYLEGLRARPGPVRVEVIRNATNRGFPAGCNQALAKARGRYVVFLNNDTVVTQGWLDGLVHWALHGWPKTGLVGCVTNYASPPQMVPCDYARLDGLGAFAERRRREFAGKALQVERLIGFCLLVRREVLQQIGGFDERFGMGFFEDDDLCLRARQSSFDLLVAQDVYIHHFGSRTFTSLGFDCRQQLHENLEQFKTKWGEERAARYKMATDDEAQRGDPERASYPVTTDPDSAIPCLPAPQSQTRAPVTVSLCMIVKNEENNLPACLESAGGLFQEIIVCDTGSTDRTKEIAERFGARGADFPWVDSFAAARNESLRHATGKWIFWLDADDRLDEVNREKLQALFAGLGDENAAYCMKCVCLPDPVNGSTTVVDHIRLFRNHPEIRWRYRVHEQILPAVRRLGGEVRWTDITIQHAGYQDPALRRRKLERDLRLLQLENTEHPDDPFTLFNLGCLSQEQDKPAEALSFLRRSLDGSHPSDSIVRKLHALIVQCHRRLGQMEEGAKSVSSRARLLSRGC